MFAIDKRESITMAGEAKGGKRSECCDYREW